MIVALRTVGVESCENSGFAALFITPSKWCPGKGPAGFPSLASFCKVLPGRVRAQQGRPRAQGGERGWRQLGLQGELVSKWSTGPLGVGGLVESGGRERSFGGPWKLTALSWWQLAQGLWEGMEGGTLKHEEGRPCLPHQNPGHCCQVGEGCGLWDATATAEGDTVRTFTRAGLHRQPRSAALLSTAASPHSLRKQPWAPPCRPGPCLTVGSHFSPEGLFYSCWAVPRPKWMPWEACRTAGFLLGPLTWPGDPVALEGLAGVSWPF